MRDDIVMISLLYLHAEWLIPVFQTGGTRKASHINKDTNACLFCVVNLTLFADCIFLQFFAKSNKIMSIWVVQCLDRLIALF